MKGECSMPFYSDAQRRFFFAVIAPMRSWGMDAVARWFLDPMAKKLGWRAEEREDVVKEIQAKLGDSQFVGIFTRTDVGKIKKSTVTDAVKEKLVRLVADGLDVPLLNQLGAKQLGAWATKVPKPRHSVKSWGEERTSKAGVFTHHHNGVDINRVDRGTPVRAQRDGVVVYVGKGRGYDKYIDFMDRDGHIHRFAHLDEYTVDVGEKVTKGTYLGTLGAGPGGVHLHYE